MAARGGAVMKVLIAGIAGGIARGLAGRLHAEGHEVLGIDTRPWPHAPSGIEVHTGDLRKRAAADLFRRARPEAVVHMATVSALAGLEKEERHRFNLGGTRALFEHCLGHGVKHVVFVGRHTFYGASPDSPLYHSESEPPLELTSYPELSDLVAADLYASTALWRWQQLRTAILRVCYSLGSSGQGTLGTFLRRKRVPTVLGFDPLFQVLDERDLVQALVLTLTQRLHGVFNVAGPQPLPLSTIVKETGRQLLPLPGPLLRRLVGGAGLPSLSRGVVNHLKYPVVVDARAFQTATGFRPAHDELSLLADYRQAHPPGG